MSKSSLNYQPEIHVKHAGFSLLTLDHADLDLVADGAQAGVKDSQHTLQIAPYSKLSYFQHGVESSSSASPGGKQKQVFFARELFLPDRANIHARE